MQLPTERHRLRTGKILDHYETVIYVAGEIETARLLLPVGCGFKIAAKLNDVLTQIRKIRTQGHCFESFESGAEHSPPYRERKG